MKKTLLLSGLCLLLHHSPLLAQFTEAPQRTGPTKEGAQRATERKEPRTYKTKLGNSKGNQIIMTIFDSNVEIIGHNSDEVIITSNTYAAPPTRAAGLKPLYNQAEDNTGLGLEATLENKVLHLTKASRQPGKYTIKVPRNASILYQETDWTGGKVSLTDIDGEIELKLNGADASLANITGPVVANTTSGDLTLKFTSLNQAKPSAISSVAGVVDVTLPANTKASFKMKSIQGEIYSDFDMSLPKNTKTNLTRVAGGHNLEGKINGGGVEMSLYTVAGEMYIRKSK